MTERIIDADNYEFPEELFIFSLSNDDRATSSVRQILDKKENTSINFKKVIIININDEEQKKNNKYTSLNYNKIDINETRNEIINRLIAKDTEIEEIEGDYSDLKKVSLHLLSEIPEQMKVLYDISGSSRALIFEILRWNKIHKFTFIYSRPKEESEGEKEFNDGVRRISVLQGYEGSMRLHKNTTLILILGFEGIRSLRMFRDIEPQKCIALIGEPGIFYEGKDKEKYITIANQNNFQLINNQKTQLDSIDSSDPIATYEKLEEIIGKLNLDEQNLILHNIGPKPSVLGSYILWNYHKNIQIMYTVPIKAGNPSRGVGKQYVYKLSDCMKN
ncbi:MAG: hypothetical protein ACYDAO_05205 [Thermoplasmataceae archaeon]